MVINFKFGYFYYRYRSTLICYYRDIRFVERIYIERPKLVFFIPINEARSDYYYINQYCYLTLQFSYSTLSCTQHDRVQRKTPRSTIKRNGVV